MPRVGVFISWSGNSRGIAEALHEWMPTALHSIQPWMSEHDIQRGTRFLEEIDRALDECAAGIICLTPENSHSMWVAFEAGALASRVSSAKLVIPVLTRMRPSDVQGPLGMFQGGQITKPEMLQLIKDLNKLNADEDRIPEARLTATFEGVWPNLEAQLPELIRAQQAPVEPLPRKPVHDLLEDILEVSRATRVLVEDRLRQSAVTVVEEPASPQEVASAEPMVSGSGLAGREGYAALKERILAATEIWLSGVSLLNIIKEYHRGFEEFLRRDRLKLRFLLLDPEDATLMRAATRSLYGVTTVEDLRQDIHLGVHQINQLRENAHGHEAVELRYLRNIPSASIIMVDPMGGNGRSIVEFYPYRASSSDRPHASLSETSQAEKKWFLFYREQFLAMWRDARPQTEELREHR